MKKPITFPESDALSFLLGRHVSWFYGDRELAFTDEFEWHEISGTIIDINFDYTVLLLDDGSHKKWETWNLISEIQDTRASHILSRYRQACEEERKKRDTTPYEIYFLIDPRDSIVKYVGISFDAKERYRQHTKSGGSNPIKRAWIQELHTAGLEPLLLIYETVEGRRKACQHETFWIEYFLWLGAPLTNLVVSTGVHIQRGSESKA